MDCWTNVGSGLSLTAGLARDNKRSFGNAMIDSAYLMIAEHSLVSWGLIHLGLIGVPGHSDRLGAIHVASFAMDRLEVVDVTSSQLAHVVALATEPSLGSQDVLHLVEKICLAIGVDQSYARRCWRYGSLLSLLNSPFDDLVYGSISVEEFLLAWSAEDLESSLPRFVLSSPSEYMSVEGYAGRIEKLREWSRIEALRLEIIGRRLRQSRIA